MPGNEEWPNSMKKIHPVLGYISSQLIFSITFIAALLVGLYFWSWIAATGVLLAGGALGIGAEKLLNARRSDRAN